MDEFKNQITNYWSRRSESFACQRVKEFSSDKHSLWLEEFKKYIPMDKQLKILDLGTGTGFFAFLLAAEGHCVTGIDLTEGMIEEANRTSALLDIPVSFRMMDAENPEFEHTSFDVLVTRNLTWTLPNLAKAYRAWHGILKPGGILINFDADYCREDTNHQLPPNHAHRSISPKLMQENERIKEVLRPQQSHRPQWDAELLLEAGFCDIGVDTSVWRRIYRDFDEFYNPTPIFTLFARA